ncbi:MAG TPA: MFS transporter [Oligoflexia bacterium]|nr:MFS transporter [Oligoflexia bacterium]HMP47144.1 MFS transporter [Oligoflexia bacterium]
MKTDHTVHLITAIRIFMVSGAIVVPGLPPLLRAHGTSIWEMEIWFAAALLLCLVPTGLLADRVGERLVMLIGSILLISGQLAYFFADSYKIFVLAELFLGTGLACIMGSDESLLHRSLGSSPKKLQFSSSWNMMVALQVIAVSLCFLAGEYASRLHEKLPFALSLIGYTGLLVSVFALGSPPTQNKARSSMRIQWVKLGRVLIFNPALLSSIVIYAFFVAVLRSIFWGYHEVLEASNSHMGVGFALSIGSLVAALSAMKSGAIKERVSSNLLLFSVGIGIGATLILMGGLLSSWCFLWVFVHQFFRGQVLTSFSAEIHEHVKDEAGEVRSAVVSFREMTYLVIYLSMMFFAHFVNVKITASGIFVTLGSITLVATLLFSVLGLCMQGVKAK